MAWRTGMIFGSILLAACISVINATEYQYSQLKEDARAFVFQELKLKEETHILQDVLVKTPSLDKIQTCDSSLIFKIINYHESSPRVLVQCQCENPSWFMKIAFKLESMIEMPVLKQDLLAGQILTEDLIENKPFDSIQHSYGLTQETIKGLYGYVSQRTVRGGQPLQRQYFIAPKIIVKGEQIQISYCKNGLQLTCLGVAMQSGALGEKIQVKNLNSGAMIHGTVVESKKVSIS